VVEASAARVQMANGEARAPWLALLWASGAVLLALVHAVRQWRFRRSLGDIEARADGCHSAPGCTGPVVFGLLRPRIVVPRDFDRRYDSAQRELILAHEHVHVRRGDVHANAVATLLQCLYWFNPMVHFALARFRVDQELACDAVVIARNPARRRSYADAMLNTQLTATGLPVGCTWQSGHPLKERIMLLNHPVPGRIRRRAGIVFALSLAVATGVAAAGGGLPQDMPVADPEASYARMPPPPYPKEAIDAKLAGTIVLRVLIGADGAPKQVEIERSAAGGVFDAPAIAAVKQWTFNPAQRNGKPVDGWVLVPITFSLDDDVPADPPKGAGGEQSLEPAAQA
jgi:TonB family protein